MFDIGFSELIVIAIVALGMTGGVAASLRRVRALIRKETRQLLRDISSITIGIVMPSVSASWKPSVPSSSVRTWPVRKTTGVESIIASVMAVTRFVAPGPLVARQTPTLPVARA